MYGEFVHTEPSQSGKASTGAKSQWARRSTSKDRSRFSDSDDERIFSGNRTRPKTGYFSDDDSDDQAVGKLASDKRPRNIHSRLGTNKGTNKGRGAIDIGAEDGINLPAPSFSRRLDRTLPNTSGRKITLPPPGPHVPNIPAAPPVPQSAKMAQFSTVKPSLYPPKANSPAKKYKSDSGDRDEISQQQSTFLMPPPPPPGAARSGVRRLPAEFPEASPSPPGYGPTPAQNSGVGVKTDKESIHDLVYAGFTPLDLNLGSESERIWLRENFHNLKMSDCHVHWPGITRHQRLKSLATQSDQELMIMPMSELLNNSSLSALLESNRVRSPLVHFDDSSLQSSSADFIAIQAKALSQTESTSKWTAPWLRAAYYAVFTPKSFTRMHSNCLPDSIFPQMFITEFENQKPTFSWVTESVVTQSANLSGPSLLRAVTREAAQTLRDWCTRVVDYVLLPRWSNQKPEPALIDKVIASRLLTIFQKWRVVPTSTKLPESMKNTCDAVGNFVFYLASLVKQNLCPVTLESLMGKLNSNIVHGMLKLCLSFMPPELMLLSQQAFCFTDTTNPPGDLLNTDAPPVMSYHTYKSLWMQSYLVREIGDYYTMNELTFQVFSKIHWARLAGMRSRLVAAIPMITRVSHSIMIKDLKVVPTEYVRCVLIEDSDIENEDYEPDETGYYPYEVGPPTEEEKNAMAVDSGSNTIDSVHSWMETLVPSTSGITPILELVEPPDINMEAEPGAPVEPITEPTGAVPIEPSAEPIAPPDVPLDSTPFVPGEERNETENMDTDGRQEDDIEMGESADGVEHPVIVAQLPDDDDDNNDNDDDAKSTVSLSSLASTMSKASSVAMFRVMDIPFTAVSYSSPYGTDVEPDTTHLRVAKQILDAHPVINVNIKNTPANDGFKFYNGPVRVFYNLWVEAANAGLITTTAAEFATKFKPALTGFNTEEEDCQTIVDKLPSTMTADMKTVKAYVVYYCTMADTLYKLVIRRAGAKKELVDYDLRYVYVDQLRLDLNTLQLGFENLYHMYLQWNSAMNPTGIPFFKNPKQMNTPLINKLIGNAIGVSAWPVGQSE
uniref:Protein ORF30 n=1 Tax=Anguillid herpesvirus 1 TaxID=150286 RepID=A0A8E5EVW0_9VIRU|nr:protein ORF30 [Anguillid herpesvirus 1]